MITKEMDSKQEEIAPLTALLNDGLTSGIGVIRKKPSHPDADFACLRLPASRQAQAGTADRRRQAKYGHHFILSLFLESLSCSEVLSALQRTLISIVSIGWHISFLPRLTTVKTNPRPRRGWRSSRENHLRGHPFFPSWISSRCGTSD